MRTTLGRRLKQCRELAGLSQNELSKRADVPRPTISDLESGKQVGLTLENARKLARALGVTLDFLAGPGDEDDEEAPRRRVAVVV
jgi:transcriptional regulator with XRE-family HTH domain